MNQLQRFSVVTQLADELQSVGSWSGETHLQKSTYFLQELFEVDTGYDFILYRHGPFSFDLRDDLTQLRANGMVELVLYPPYGPRIKATGYSQEIRLKFPKTLARVEPAIEFVAQHLGHKDVTQLERLATALFVLRNASEEGGMEELAVRVNQVKPHVSVEEAAVALAEVQQLQEQASAV